jgi:hypothetical protein
MGLHSWSFEWQGHLSEIDWFQSTPVVGLWQTDVVRLRIDGKKVDEQKKTMPWPLYISSGVPMLAGQIEGDDGKLHLIKVKFSDWNPCVVTIDGEKVFKGD